MAITINVNGESINYPETGDTNWSDEATDFAVQTASAFGKLGLDIGTSVDIPQTLDVTGATTLDSTLTVAGTTTLNGTANLNGNTNLGNGSSDTIAVTGILNVDSGVLYVDPTNNRVGINDTTPSQALDVTGNVAITGNETVGGTLGVTGATSLSSTLGVTGATSLSSTLGVTGATSLSSTLGVTGDVAVNTNKFNVTASSGNTTIAGTLGVSGNTTVGGVTYLDDDTTANTPVLSFTGDTNTGIGRSAADALDFITNGNSRFKIEATGQIQAVIPSNATLYPGYLCRAWVNFDGTLSGTISPRGSGNISSVVKNSTGNYTINIDTDMPDVNYCAVATTISSRIAGISSRNAGNVGVTTVNVASTLIDPDFVAVSVFR